MILYEIITIVVGIGTKGVIIAVGDIVVDHVHKRVTRRGNSEAVEKLVDLLSRIENRGKAPKKHNINHSTGE